MSSIWKFILKLVKPLVILIGKFGVPERKITGKDYYKIRDDIEPGTVFLTRTSYELSNLINPGEIKHTAIYIGNINGGKVKYILEANADGVVIKDLVTFLGNKDLLIVTKPKFIRGKENFTEALHNAAKLSLGTPYDYMFELTPRAFYCYELVAACFKYAYPELQLKCKEIVKGKRIYDGDTFLDANFFEVVFDSRNR